MNMKSITSKNKSLIKRNISNYSKTCTYAKSLASGYHPFKEQFQLYKSYNASTFAYESIGGGNYRFFAKDARFSNKFKTDWKIKIDSTTDGTLHGKNNHRNKSHVLNIFSYRSNNNINVEAYRKINMNDLPCANKY